MDGDGGGEGDAREGEGDGMPSTPDVKVGLGIWGDVGDVGEGVGDRWLEFRRGRWGGGDARKLH